MKALTYLDPVCSRDLLLSDGVLLDESERVVGVGGEHSGHEVAGVEVGGEGAAHLGHAGREVRGGCLGGEII